MHNVFLTVDVDWAPDWAIADLHEHLIAADLPATWFVTHATPLLSDLRADASRVELGIHPNFLPGSSHGTTAEDVLDSCMELVPEARTMRTHCLLQSTPIFQAVVDHTPINMDTSMYLRDGRNILTNALPLDHGRVLRRVPFVWEDDLEFFAESPNWDAATFLERRDGPGEITVIDVHPVHFALNSASIDQYRALKAAVGDTRRATRRDAARLRNKGSGARTFILGLAEAVERGRARTLSQL
jgi:hypothetical protein